MITIKTNSKKDILIHIGIMLCIAMILILGFFFIYLPVTTHHGESITVPDLTGMQVGELEEFLEARDLSYEVRDSDYVSTLAPLSVKDQYPKAGAKVKEGRKIILTIIAKNPPQVPAPNLIDISLRSAQMLLQSSGLEQGKLTYKPDLCQNCVLAQEFEGKPIKPGTKIPKGSKIDLIVGDGAGNQEFKVPNLTGLSLEEAKVVLSGSDLQLGSVQYDNTSDQPAGTIARQNPPAVEGNKIRMGEIIDVWVSGSGPGSTPSNEPVAPQETEQ